MAMPRLLQTGDETMRVTIADSGFINNQKSMCMGSENCDVSPSYFEWERADPKDARFVTESCMRDAVGKGQVAWLQETFFMHPENYTYLLDKKFDYVLTHNRYFADNNENWLWCPHGGSWIRLEDWKIYEKTKMVSMLVTPKKMVYAHRLRHEIKELLGDKVDIYGYSNYSDKRDMLIPYRFHIIVLEACEGFFNEQIIDCMATGTIPIIRKQPDIRRYFEYGVIRFEDKKHLEGIVDNLISEELYLKMLPYSKINIETAKMYRSSEDYAYEHYPFLFEVN